MTELAQASDSGPPPSATGEIPIEGGEVHELEDVPFEARHRAETARSLAKWLVLLLAAGLVTHYSMTVVLAFGGKEEASKNLASAFNAWLPAVSSLVSAAVTYYFTKEKA